MIRRIFRSYLRPQLGRQLLAFLFMALDAAMTGLLAWLMEPVFNRVFAGGGGDWILPISLAVFAAFVFRASFAYVHGVLMNAVGQKLVAAVQRDLFAHLLRADLRFFHSNPAGGLVARLTSDVGVMRLAAAECLTNIGKNALQLLVLVGIMLIQDWRLAALMFILFPPAAWGIARLGRRARKNAVRTQVEVGSFASLLTQTFQGARHVKAYGMEGYEVRRAGASIQRLYRLAVKAYRIAALSAPMMELLTGTAVALTVFYGGYRIVSGEMSVGELMSFITALALAFEPMKRLAKLNAQLQAGLGATERVFAVMDTEPDIQDRPGASELAVDRATVDFDAVTFAYGGGETALRDFSLHVPAGQTVALVGASGAGKSTVLNLIPRFYDVQSGSVRVAGQDVRDVTLASLRRQIALVSQDVAMFDDTIRANIAYGSETASFDEIVAAAKAAAAHDFILSMPDGYDTPIGEHGVKLSGGQRQRLALARAFLKDAPILLLDEATSALDAESERAVQAALGRLRIGRTTLVVAHRLSTVIDADRICVLEQGRIVETGTHIELLRQGGYYARLYGEQPADAGPPTATRSVG